MLMKMWSRNFVCYRQFLNIKYSSCWYYSSSLYSKSTERNYSEEQASKILNVINNDNPEDLARYQVSKSGLKKLSQWKKSNGKITSLSDIEIMVGVPKRSAIKLFDSIVDDAYTEKKPNNIKIKGQILHPNLTEKDINNCSSVLAISVTASSVCWTLIDKQYYEVLQWQYYGIDYPDGKKFQLTDILDIAWRIMKQLPLADIYVMKSEATTLRAAGSDPNNPKALTVNLQKSQLVSMIVALINSRSYEQSNHEDDAQEILKQKVYFLRPTLPYRLYGTLIGNERVSTEQTVNMILEKISTKCTSGSRLYVTDDVKSTYTSQNDLQKDMMGNCLLLGITFMDVCIYKNIEKIEKLLKSTQ